MMLFHDQNKIGFIYLGGGQLGGDVFGHSVAMFFKNSGSGGFDGLAFYGAQACGAHDDVGGRKGDPQEVFGGRAAANIANADNQDSFKQGSFLCAKHAQPARALNESSRPLLPVQGVAVPINKGCRHQYDVAMAWAGAQLLRLYYR